MWLLVTGPTIRNHAADSDREWMKKETNATPYYTWSIVSVYLAKAALILIVSAQLHLRQFSGFIKHFPFSLCWIFFLCHLEKRAQHYRKSCVMFVFVLLLTCFFFFKDAVCPFFSLRSVFVSLFGPNRQLILISEYLSFRLAILNENRVHCVRFTSLTSKINGQDLYNFSSSEQKFWRETSTILI